MTVWMVDTNDRILSYEGDGAWRHTAVLANAKDLYIHKGTPYIIGEDNGLWKSAGKFGWARMNLVEAT